MSDLISRSALIEVIFKEWGGDPAYFIGDDNPITDRLAFAAGYAVSLLNNAPAVDAEPVKHGRWVWKGHYLVCSECGEENDRKNYCPNCGAQMFDEVEE